MKTLEKEILDILSEDARFTPKQIAAMLGAEESEIKAAVHSMEERGLLVKYTAIINSELADRTQVEALIEVKVTPKKGEGFDWMAKQIAAYPEVKGVYLMSGGYDLAVFIEDASLQKVARFVSERISTFEGVLSTATHFILKKYKIEGALTERADADNRLSVHPYEEFCHARFCQPQIKTFTAERHPQIFRHRARNGRRDFSRRGGA